RALPRVAPDCTYVTEIDRPSGDQSMGTTFSKSGDAKRVVGDSELVLVRMSSLYLPSTATLYANREPSGDQAKNMLSLANSRGAPPTRSYTQRPGGESGVGCPPKATC